jgi:hypothetical protein
VVENGPLRRPVSPLRGRDRLSTALAFDAITARFEGKFKDQNNNVVSIDGLGARAFGNGMPASDLPISLTKRYFSPPALRKDMMVYSEH